LTENGGWIGEVSITNPEQWQRVIDLAERFEVEMKDIGKVMQQVDKDGKESFRFFSKDGSTVTTLGQDSKQILYLSKVLGDSTKLINDYEKSITKVSSAFKGAFKGDDVSVGKFTDSLQKMFDLYSKIQGIKDSKLVSKEDLDRIKQIEQRLKNVLADTVNPHTIEDKLEGSMPDYIDRVKESANGLRGIFEQIFSTHAISNAEELTSAIKNFGTVLLDAKDDANKLAKDTKIVNMIKTIETELNKNSAMLPEHKKRYQDLLTTLRNAFDGTEKASKESIQGILVQLMKLQGEVQATGKTGLNFLDRLKKAISTNLVQYIARFLSIQDIVRYVRTISSTIVDLDTALVDLKKTTAMDSDQLESFYVNSTNVAKSMGVSTKQIIEQAAAWSRLGYNTEEASTKMAELSSKFKAISPGMNLENATDGLVSTMQAFHIKVEDAERTIMDSINRVGNTMATSNDEIVEMLKRSSAAMYAANNTLAETIALEAASVQITRNAQITGTAFRTISMRIICVLPYGDIWANRQLKTVKLQRWTIPWVRFA
jgi:hypothetical protein